MHTYFKSIFLQRTSTFLPVSSSGSVQLFIHFSLLRLIFYSSSTFLTHMIFSIIEFNNSTTYIRSSCLFNMTVRDIVWADALTLYPTSYIRFRFVFAFGLFVTSRIPERVSSVSSLCFLFTKQCVESIFQVLYITRLWLYNYYCLIITSMIIIATMVI